VKSVPASKRLVEVDNVVDVLTLLPTAVNVSTSRRQKMEKTQLMNLLLKMARNIRTMIAEKEVTVITKNAMAEITIEEAETEEKKVDLEVKNTLKSLWKL
jgi:hypothetical protein